MKKTDSPLVLMISGKAKVVVQDEEAHQELLDPVETLTSFTKGWPT